MTIDEYNRRWTLIMDAFLTGELTAKEASDAVKELTTQRLR